MPRPLPFLLAWSLVLSGPHDVARSDDAVTDPISLVRPIDWARLDHPGRSSPDLEISGRLALNAARYNAAWVDRTYQLGPAGDRYVVANKNNEHVIRPPCSVAYGLAVVLRTGLFDEKAVGVTRDELTRRVVRLIKGTAMVHRTSPGGAWGDHWQSSHWAGALGQAGWMMWDDLDAEARAAVARLVAHEADRHIAPGYRVPYWNGKGGDTKAEENAWETQPIVLAVMMMPDHPHAKAWKEIASRLMVSAFAREADRDRTDVTIDGRTPRDWLEGWNLRDDGTLVNHNRIHDDYMTTVVLNLRSWLVCSLAGRPVPEAFDFNFPIVYGALQTTKFPSPPYNPPGGSMYRPGEVAVYYPQGNDWSTHRIDIYYKMDLFARRLKADRGLPLPADHWVLPRAKAIEAMQARHEDGRLYARGEFDSYPNPEAMGLWVLADAFLLQWLDARDALTPKSNWLAQP
jgi:hypothetical protein